jgi:hypothetical protein
MPLTNRGSIVYDRGSHFSNLFEEEPSLRTARISIRRTADPVVDRLFV